MALARIITRSEKQAQKLAGQLRARGYEVEILLPEQAADAEADLEIKLDECSVEEALSQASSSGDRNSSVVIAPGAIAGVRPITAMPLVNPGDATREQDELENLTSLPWVQAQAQTHRQAGQENFEREDHRVTPVLPEQSAQPAEVYVYEDAKLSPLERLRLPRLRFPKPRLRLPKLSLPSLSWHLPRVRVPRPGMSFHVPRVRLRIPKSELRLPHFSWPRLKLHVPRIKVRVPRLSFRIPAFGVRVPRISWRMPKLAIPKFSFPARRESATAMSASAPPSESALKERTLPGRARASNALFWDSAVAFGILAVCGLMVGGLLHSRTPLPPRLTQQSANSTQQVPFAKVKPVVPSPPPAVRVVPDETVKPAPIAAPDLAAQKKPSAQVAQGTTRRSHRTAKSQARSTAPVKLAQRSRSTEADGDYVAQDTVVHYGKNK